MASVRTEKTSESSSAVEEAMNIAKAALDKFVFDTNPLFDQLDGSGTIKITSLRPDWFPHVIINIEDIKALWSRLTFVVTDKSYPAGYGGSFDYESATSHIRYNTVNGWNAHPGGLSLIVLHELLHSTRQGSDVWRTQWTEYRKDCRNRGVDDDSGQHYWKSSFFSEVEEFCYHGSRELMGALRLPPYEGPAFEHGYDYGDLDR